MTLCIFLFFTHIHLLIRQADEIKEDSQMNKVVQIQHRYQKENIRVDEKKHFLDGEIFDLILERINKGLFFLMIFFCLPYFLFLLFNSFF